MMRAVQESSVQHLKVSPNFGQPPDYLFRPDIQSFRKAWFPQTYAIWEFFSISFLVSALAFFFLFEWPVLVTLSGLIAFFYLGHMVFKLLVVQRSLAKPFLTFSKEEIVSLSDEELPLYTILIPLYQEAEVVWQIRKAMEAIDYPKAKLEILITLEQYDYATQEAIARADFPSYFRILLLPDVPPKTKPKALNVALLRAKGEFLVIYDAEIIPDPDQLKKAVLAFRKHPEIAFLQTRLDHYNTDQNILTKLFNIEFNFYYDLFLPGLQKFRFPLPLSGHSTHFRRSAIEEVGGWDPYNVAEDCDIGIVLYRHGYRSEILDSVSKEEATTTLPAWMRQRSRWMKGFLQSSIVHLRHPLELKKDLGGWINFTAFLFIVPGTVLLNFLNLFYWLLLVGWFVTYSVFIQELFTGPILPISVISSLGGNALFVYFNLIGSYRRGKYGLVKYALLSPFYWILLAVASGKAVIQLFTKPYHWEKTAHGTHLAQVKSQAASKESSLGEMPIEFPA
ncbi:MAG: glycosyltransferase [Candidatus Wildermuthbacteria bacterium]|nr:glycosyltransferase [Candidatus Wildermuthbacteria bacterium]